jgi:hypothetical protein
MIFGMPTLTSGAPLGEVAEILHAAAVLGCSAWNRGSGEEARFMPDIEEQLERNLRDLFALLNQRQIPYLLVGGIAMLTYVDGRNTKDVDLVLSVKSLERIPEIAVLERDHDFARCAFAGVRVDVLFTTNPLFELVQEQHATPHRFLETEVRCATVEGLITLKLYALLSLYRQGDGQRIGLYENDIFMLCERYRPKMEPIFATIRAHVDDGQIGELRSIVLDIEARIARVDRLKRPPASP